MIDTERDMEAPVKRSGWQKNTTISFMFKRSRWRIFFFTIVILLIAYLNLGFDTVWELDRTRDELILLNDKVESLRSERDSLINVLSRLEGDMDYVEKVAREDFGMIRKKERVYPLPKSSED